MNMLIGLLCEEIGTVATNEREAIIVDKVYDKFHDMLENVDADRDGFLSWPEFANLLLTDSCQHDLRKLDVDVRALVDMVEDMFFDSSPIDKDITIKYDQIIEVILDLRGSQVASVKDVMAIGKRFNVRFRELEDWLVKLGNELGHVTISPPGRPLTPCSARSGL